MQATHHTLSENTRAQSAALLNKQISASLAAFGQSVREASQQASGFGDAGTADLLTEVSRGIDRQLWFVGSHAPAKADVRAVPK